MDENDPSRLPDDQIQAIRDAVLHGQKIQAIKLYREATGLGLVESKDFIEALEARLRQQEPEQFTSAGAKVGCVGVIGIVSATTTLASWWL